jgi:hypothetical protein
METDVEKQKKIAAMNKEIDDIHFVNSLFWQRGEASTSEERAEYQRRLARLDELRREVAKLQSE